MNAKSLLYIGVPVVLLGGLYVALKPQRAELPKPSAPPALVTPQAPATGGATVAVPAASTPAKDEAPIAAVKPNVFDIVVKNGKLASEPAALKVHQGDDVTITITTDKADRFHMHGYDLHADLSPGKTVTLQFTAKLTGRFPLELHQSGLTLGALEVFPQ